MRQQPPHPGSAHSSSAQSGEDKKYKGDDFARKAEGSDPCTGQNEERTFASVSLHVLAFPLQQALPGSQPHKMGLSMRPHAVGSHPKGHPLLQDRVDVLLRP